jgi:glycosyltransferase involved in cell wall biosynthesis
MNLMLICLEKNYRGGTRYLENMHSALQQKHISANLACRSNQTRRKFYFSVFKAMHNSNVIILNAPRAILLRPLFFSATVFFVFHTPADRLKRHTRIFIKLMMRLYKTKCLYVATHIKRSHDSVMNYDLKYANATPEVLYCLPPNSSDLPVSNEKKIRDLVLIFTGGDSQEKNLLFAIKTHQLLLGQGIGCQLHVYGNVKNIHIYQHIHGLRLFGFKPIGWNYYAFAKTLHLMPSFYEGMPLSAIEAMKHGIHTLLSDIPASRELATICPASVTIQPLNADAWAHSIMTSMRFDCSLRIMKDYEQLKAISNFQLGSFLEYCCVR